MSRSGKEIQIPRVRQDVDSDQSKSPTADEVRARLHRIGGRTRMPLNRRIARAERGVETKHSRVLADISSKR